MNNYEIVLGLEIHIQLKTKYKMFCGCKNDPFFSKPNTNVCPTCLGLPGAMPVVNKEALISAQKVAYALSGNLNKNIKFERKNYFYPDLPKGFQLTCPHYPLSIGGKYVIENNDKPLSISFREIHLEEDTAKSMHKEGKTFIDYNKSGVPLLEIVTEPDFHDIDDAVKFCKEIQLLTRYLEVSNADMEKGQMRLEANISVRKTGDKNLPDYRIELKNINSFGFMRKALQHELRRHVEELEKGNILYQETRGFDEKKQKTFLQRSKEEPNDYRYFPEPDIPPIFLDKQWIAEITTSVYSTPNKVREKLKKENLNKELTEAIVKEPDLYEKYNDLRNLNYKPAKAADYVVNIKTYKNKSAQEIDKLEKQKSKNQISDKAEIRKLIEIVCNENSKAVADYKKGNKNSLQFLMGQLMKETKGKIDINIAKESLLTYIENL